jgi:hypothetical protein
MLTNENAREPSTRAGRCLHARPEPQLVEPRGQFKVFPGEPAFVMRRKREMTLFQRISMSGWCQAFSATLAIRFTNRIDAGKSSNSYVREMAGTSFFH